MNYDERIEEVNKKLEEIREHRRQMVTLRKSSEATSKQMREEVEKLNLLEMELTTARTHELSAFRNSLELEGLKLQGRVVGKNLVLMEFMLSDTPQAATVIVHKKEKKEKEKEKEKKAEDGDEEKEVLVEMQYTESKKNAAVEGRWEDSITTKGLSPKQKWLWLFSMFRESRGGAFDMDNPGSGLPSGATEIEEEKAKIRSTLYTLRQKKQMNRKEMRMNEYLHARLKYLNQLSMEE